MFTVCSVLLIAVVKTLQKHHWLKDRETADFEMAKELNV